MVADSRASDFQNLAHFVEGAASKLVSDGPRPVLLVNLPGEKLGDFKLVPMVAGNTSGEEVAQVLDRLWGADDASRRTSYVHDAASAVRSAASESAPASEPRLLRRGSVPNNASACSVGASSSTGAGS